MTRTPAGRESGAPRAPRVRRALLTWLEHRDPDLRATKRSIRAAVLVPAVFAVAVYTTTNGQTPFFAVFGSVALLLFADFGGPRRVRFRSYVGLAATGAVCISFGTVCSADAAAAVVSMAAVGFCILFAGVVSPQAVAGSTAALLTFMLSVAVPAHGSAMSDRLFGWALAVVVCVPAALWIWDARWHDRLRGELAASSRAVADLVAAHADTPPDAPMDTGPADTAAAALRQMRAQYEATPYRPTGAGPSDVALTTLVARLEWAGARAAAASGLVPSTEDRPTVRAVEQAAADVLHTVADILGADGPSGSSAPGARLSAAATTLAAARVAASDQAVAAVIAGVDADDGFHGAGGHGGRPPFRMADVDPTYPVRMLAFATEMCADVAPTALDDPEVGTGWSRRRATLRASLRLARSHLSLRSVWFRNSVRGAVGLALAVSVVEVTSVRHGFWVVLGALSVLRSNALGTGTTALRAVVGTAVGVVLGSVLLLAFGGHDDRLWIVLPFAVLLAGVAPSVISFTAGQAGFTIMAVLVLTIVSPAGSSIAVVRIEDVVIGAVVSVIVGLLFWPRGASAELAFAMAEAYSSATSWLVGSIELVGRLVDDPAVGPESTVRATATRSAHRLDDAYRQFLSERGAKQVRLPVLSELLTGCARIRLTAVTLDALPVPAAPEGSSTLPAVVAARDEVSRAVSGLEVWFGSLAASIGSRALTVPPVPAPTDQVPVQLSRAWEAARRAGRRDAVYAVLRLLWVEQRLDDMRRLQTDLADLVGTPTPPAG